MYQRHKIGIAGIVACTLLLMFSNNVLAFGSKGRVEPVFARYARTYASPTFDLKIEYFRDKPMEEMDDFNGYTGTLDMTFPLNDVSQLEFLLPFYTKGKGDYNKPGNPLDGHALNVKGYGGVRDFASLIYERQLPWLESQLGFNIAWMAGIGQRQDPLDAKNDGDLVDKFDHKGHNYQLGLKADADIHDDEITLFGNLRYVMFRDTDDINLTDSDIDFEVLYATGAVMFNTYGQMTPVVEILLEHDFRSFTSFSLSPEIIYTFLDGLDIKLSTPFKLTSDGQDMAAVVELTHRF